MEEHRPKKSLGQHWLNDETSLKAIVEAADLGSDDAVLEIGPGQGSLTKVLVQKAQQVVAVEVDKSLAANLEKKNLPRLQVLAKDILRFNLTSLPKNYKVVANIPYYLTSNLIRRLNQSSNPPSLIVLLVQKEVAQRLAAKPGQMSLLGVSAQLFNEVSLGRIVPAKLFTPPPKVDSQIVVLRRRQQPLFHELDEKQFFRLVKAGFSERRKKLRSSLAGGLGISKEKADELLEGAGISGTRRAQELSLKDWHRLYLAFKSSL